MKTLYESILDTDIQAQSDVLDRPLQELVDFLMLNKPRSGRYKYTVAFGKLYVSGSKNYNVESFQFIVNTNKVLNKRNLTGPVIDLELLNLVYFDNVQIYCDTSEPIPFLSHCNNCVITFKGFTDDTYKGLDNILSKTKGNTINVWSTKKEYEVLFDYSFLNGLNLGNCRLILYTSADLSTIKNLTTRELVIQRGSKFEKNGPIFEADRELSDYFIQKLDEFLARNKIISFGMVDSFIQYIDWFVKKEHDYEIKLLRHDIKRVPKIR